MSVVFSVRGGSTKAYYTTGERENGWLASGASDVPVVIDKAGAIGGKAIQSGGSTICVSSVIYNGGTLGKQTNFSVLARVAVRFNGRPPFLTLGLWEIFTGGNVSQANQGTFGAQVFSDYTQTPINGNTGAAYSWTADKFVDIVFTYDGGKTASAAQLFIDGATWTTWNASDTYSTGGLTRQETWYSAVGSTWGSTITQPWYGMYIDEIVVWNEIIDPTPAGLDLSGPTRTKYVTAPAPDHGISNKLDISGIIDTFKNVLDNANAVDSYPRDLSDGLSDRVKQVLKLNPELHTIQASFLPAITIFCEEKNVENDSIAPKQNQGKRKATLLIKVVALMWNTTATDFRQDNADDELNTLTENIEDILRAYPRLGNLVSWQKLLGVSYVNFSLDEETHYRAGVMDYEVVTYY